MRFFLKTLRVNRAPGFPVGFNKPLQFHAGFNLVFGRNASGKTVLSQTIQKLIWRNQHDKHDASGEVSVDGQQGTLGISYGTTRVELPIGQHATLDIAGNQDKLYLLSHEQILRDTDKGGDIAAAILKEYSGGYNIDAANSSAGGNATRPKSNHAVYTQYTDAEKKLSESVDYQKTLSKSQEELSELEKERKSALEAESRRSWLQCVHDFLVEKNRADSLKADVDRFPPKIDIVSQEICNSLQRAMEEKQALEERISTAENAMNVLRTKITSLHPATETATDPQIQTLQEKINTYKVEVATLRDLENELAGLKGREKEQLDRFGIDPDNPDLNRPPEVALTDVKNLIRRFQQVDSKLEALKAKENVNQRQLEQTRTDLPAADDLVRAEDTVKTWLQSSEQKGMPAYIPYLLIALGLILNTVLIINTARKHHLTIVVLVSLATLLFYALLHFLHARKPKGRPAVDLNPFQHLGISIPSEQTVSAMAILLQNILGLKQDIATRGKLENTKGDIQQEMTQAVIQKQDILSELDTVRARLVNLPETSPEQDPEIILTYLSNWDAWYRLQDDKGKVISQIDHQKEVVNPLKEEWMELAEQIPITESTDADAWLNELKGFIDQLKDRNTWKADLQHKERERDQAAQDKKKKEETISNLMSPFLPEYASLEGLRDLNRSKGSYQTKLNEYIMAKTNVERLEGQLIVNPTYANDLEEDRRKDLHTLQQEIQACNQKIESKDAIVREMANIEAHIKKVATEFPLEQAIMKKDEALVKLDDLLVNYLKSKTVDVISKHLKETIEKTNRPKVLETASNYFSDFTSNRYELNVDHQANGRFIAIDHQRDMRQDVSELSTATKVQLILAVRLAYIDSVEENHYRLPILADELLAGSDDERSNAIMEALIKVANTGRQVFYFTAEGDELGRWQKLLDDRGIEYGQVPLGDPPMPVFHPPSDIHNPLAGILMPPAPEGKNHTEYGKALDLGTFDLLQASLDQLHPWYLFEDVESIHDMLTRNQKNWSMLRNAIARNGILGPLTDEAYRRAGQLMEVLKVYQTEYRKGRSRPVEFDVVLKSGSVTPTFRERVENLLNQVRKDSLEFVNGLQDIPHFHRTTRERLRFYLIDQGYISEDPIVPQEELASRLLVEIQNRKLDKSLVERCLDRINKGPA